MTTIHQIKIGTAHGTQEEGPCLYCGSPLYVRDIAFETHYKSTGDVAEFAFCSRYCARQFTEPRSAIR